MLSVLGCHEAATHSGRNQKRELAIVVPPDAQQMVVRQVAWPQTVRTQGSLFADEQAIVSAKVPGRVEETFVEFGDPVKKDQPLARLEQSDFELRIRQAEAQLAEACATLGIDTDSSVEDVQSEDVPFVAVEKAIWDEAVEARDRLARLQQTNSVSESEFKKQSALARVGKAKFDAALRTVDKQKALIESNRVQLEIARQNMADATVRAPFEGVVHQRHLAAGTFVQAGSRVFTLVRIDPLRFRGQIPERKATSVQVDNPLSITIEGSDQLIETKIKRVSPVLDLASRSLRVEAEVPNRNRQFRSGLFAEGIVVVDKDATALAIPRTALGEFAGVYKVWLIKDEHLLSQRVSLGREKEDLIEIATGLKVGDKILVDANEGERARQSAKPKSNSEAAES